MPAIGKAAWAWKGPGKEWWSAVLDPTKPRLNVMDYMGPNRAFLKHCGKEIIRAYRGESKFKVIFGKKGKGRPIRIGTYFEGIKKRKSPTEKVHKPLSEFTYQFRKAKKKMGAIPTARNRTFILRETDKHLLKGIGILEIKPAQVIVGWSNKEDREIAQIHQNGAKIPVVADASSRDPLMRVLGKALGLLELANLSNADIGALKLFREKLGQLSHLKRALKEGRSAITFRGGTAINLYPNSPRHRNKGIWNALRSLGFQHRKGYASTLLQQYAEGEVASSDFWYELSAKRIPRAPPGRITTLRYGKKAKKFMEVGYETRTNEMQNMDDFIRTFLLDQKKLLRRFGVDISIKEIEGNYADPYSALYGDTAADAAKGIPFETLAGLSPEMLKEQKYLTKIGVDVNVPVSLRKKKYITIPQRAHYGFSKDLMKSLSTMGIAWLGRGLK